MDIKVADEVWIGCALLHIENPGRESFSNNEILGRVEKENLHGYVRPGVRIHIYSHCIANKPSSPNTCRMLYELPDGTKRLFKATDSYHFTRERGKIMPDPYDIPQEYQRLIEWYRDTYNQGKQPLPQSSPSKVRTANLQVETIDFSNEREMLEFSYRCPTNSGVSCKKCPSFVEEDEVKNAIAAMLTAEKWNIEKTAMGKTHGADIVATRKPAETMIIEAKGEGSLNPMRVNYFLMVIGELIQEMDSPDKCYGLGFPAYHQYTRLIVGLPLWIKKHLNLRIFLVKKLEKERYAVGYLSYQ